jgi:hypothetical protein
MAFRMTLLLVVLAGCGPMGETPGLRLGGQDAAAPESFAVVSEHPIIQLEARGAFLPRVVNIWGVGLDAFLYVWTGPETGWGQRVAERPDVRVRIGDATYELHATRVQDAAEQERVFRAYIAKYGKEIEELFGRPGTLEDFDLLYRLAPRA